MGTDTLHDIYSPSKACSWLFSVSIASVLAAVPIGLAGTLAAHLHLERCFLRFATAACLWQLDAARCCWLRLLRGPICGTRMTLRVACVCVSCGAAQGDTTLASSAAQGPPLAALSHDELDHRRLCCARSLRQQVEGREGRAEPEGVREHALLRRSAPPDGLLACLPAWLPVAARLPNLDRG